MTSLPLTGLDYAFIAILGMSLLVGLMRGLVREALSLAAWGAAIWAAGQYDSQVAAQLGGIFDNALLRIWAARAAILIAVLLAGGIAGWLMGMLVNASGLSTVDRSVGAVFGLVRGIVLVAIVAIAIQLGGLADQPWSRQSKLLPYVTPIVDALRSVADDKLRSLSVGLHAGQAAASAVVSRSL
ncbi:MAG: CvpA family protein [Gammaproteobacteria bacterium]|nr:CvpA family protein [Gammaproteobacteria bacterium]